MANEQEQPPEKEKIVKDSFLDDLMYVAKESLSPAADPKNDPVPGEEKSVT